MRRVIRVTGGWTYRSFRNLPQILPELDMLLFAQGALELEQRGATLCGALSLGEELLLDVSGVVEPGAPLKVRFKAAGASGLTVGWEYQHEGFLLPQIPGAIENRRVIAGTVLRVTTHSGGQAPAGIAASFIAIEQD